MTECLLDTHVLLWSLFAPEKLSRATLDVLTDGSRPVFVSSVSLWEISLKYALGKLHLEGCGPAGIVDAARKTGFVILPLLAAEAGTFHRLPRMAHKDPFDRMLIHQAICRDMTLVSRDGDFGEYRQHGLKLLW